MKMSSEICLCLEKLQVYENIEKKTKTFACLKFISRLSCSPGLFVFIVFYNSDIFFYDY